MAKLPLKHITISMKDRIRQIMESQKMTQQEFADYIGLAPATLSSIFNGRTRPTLNVVEALKKKIPNISIDWLMFGSGDMYVSSQSDVIESEPTSSPSLFSNSPTFEFDQSSSPTPQNGVLPMQNTNGVKSTRSDIVRDEVKIIEKPQRRVIEIRVFYDDQTWDTFVPAKK